MVESLGGEPGVFSARYSGARATDQQNNRLLLSNLQGKTNRFAYYHCALVFLRSPNDPVPIICQGRWEGKILEQPLGEHGFGYDPLFWVSSHQCSVAQMPEGEKVSISHRGKALRQMLIEIKEIMRGELACQEQ